MIQIIVDVLVIGGSGAGISAAISAANLHKKVLLVSKGKIGRNGNAIMAGGSFSIDGASAKQFGYETANEKVTEDVVFDNLVKEGYFLNDQKVVQQFVEESPQVAYDLVKVGEKAGQKFAFLPPGKWFSVGRSWGRALQATIKLHPEVEILEDCNMVELLQDGKRVVGAAGYFVYTGELVVVQAAAVVMATGGFLPFSFKNTVTDMSGDGIGMAFRAGAKIADMEFLLCFPTALSPLAIKGSIYPYLFQILMGKWGLNPTIRDGNGEIIHVPQEVEELVKGSKMTKLVSCYYWGKRIFEGHGTPNGGIYFDYSSTPQEKKLEIIDRYIEYMSTWHRPGYYMGDDISEIYQRMRENQYLEVGLACEYSNGGIVINEKMETNLEGFFAAGEVTSGAFGAMRAGDGLTEMLVQGYRAGISAAQYVSGSNAVLAQETQLTEVKEKMKRALTVRKDGISPIVIKSKMEAVADFGFNYVRSGERIQKSIVDLERIENELIPEMSVHQASPLYNLELLNYFAVYNQLICLKMGLNAALMRKESRGTHIRVDYPEVNHDKYLKRIMWQTINNEIHMTEERPSVVKFELPTGQDADIMQYLFNEKHQYLRPKMR